MRSFQTSFLASLAMPPRVAGLLRRLGEHKGRQELHQRQAPEILENLRRVAEIESTESSNRLEGIVAENEKRLRELIAARAEPANRSEGEIAGYRDVLDTIHQNQAHIPFSDRVVLQFHRDLLKYAGDDGGHCKISSNKMRDT